jgi:hypothetical protein
MVRLSGRESFAYRVETKLNIVLRAKEVPVLPRIGCGNILFSFYRKIKFTKL